MKYVLLVLSFFVITATCQAQKKNVFLKINTLRGIVTVTPKIDPKEIETIFANSLQNSAYNVISEEDSILPRSADSSYFVDIFNYQFGGQTIHATMTVRKGNDIVFYSIKSKAVSLNRKSGFVDLAAKLAEDFAAMQGNEKVVHPSLKDLFPNNPIFLSAGAASAVAYSLIKDYKVDIEFKGGKDPAFICPGAFSEYMQMGLNIEGFKKSIKKEPLIINGTLVPQGNFKPKSISFGAGYSDKDKERINDLLNAIPAWYVPTNDEIAVEIKISHKK